MKGKTELWRAEHKTSKKCKRWESQRTCKRVTTQGEIVFFRRVHTAFELFTCKRSNRELSFNLIKELSFDDLLAVKCFYTYYTSEIKLHITVRQLMLGMCKRVEPLLLKTSMRAKLQDNL